MGGTNPCVWLHALGDEYLDDRTKPTLKGKPLIAAVRRVLSIGLPKAAKTEPDIEKTAALSIPPKPPTQKQTWHQWANGVMGVLSKQGADVGDVLPTGLALEMYLEGLKPSAAAQKYMERRAGRMNDDE